MADPINDALDAIQTLMANTPEFQSLTGTANAIDAATHILQGEIGTPVESIGISAGVMTVVLREPLALQVGQLITLDGAAIGMQGQDLNPVNTIGAVGLIPWEDGNGNEWRDHNGTPWQYQSNEVLAFTIQVDLPDQAVEAVDGVVLIPCVRPYALIVRGDDNSFRTKSIATGGMTIATGTADILIEARVLTANRNNALNATRAANAAFGSIISGLAALSGVADYILLNTIEPGVSPEFISAEEQNSNAGRFERWRAWIKCSWGLES